MAHLLFAKITIHYSVHHPTQLWQVGENGAVCAPNSLQLCLQYFVHQNFAFLLQFCFSNYQCERQWVYYVTQPRVNASSQISPETQKDTQNTSNKSSARILWEEPEPTCSYNVLILQSRRFRRIPENKKLAGPGTCFRLLSHLSKYLQCFVLDSKLWFGHCTGVTNHQTLA